MILLQIFHFYELLFMSPQAALRGLSTPRRNAGETRTIIGLNSSITVALHHTIAAHIQRT